MKIAICISGLIREAKACWPNFKKYLIDANPEHQFDIFVFTWQADRTLLVKYQPENDCTLDEVKQLYKPALVNLDTYDHLKKKQLFEECKIELFREIVKRHKITRRTDGRWKKAVQCEFCKHYGKTGEKCRICGGNLTHNVIAMHYAIAQAHELTIIEQLDKDISYDLFVRWRFDNYLVEPIKLNPPELNTIYVPAGYDNFPEFGGALNDQIAWGDFHSMQPYARAYYNFFDLSEQCLENGYDNYAHSILHFALKNAGIKVERPKVDYSLYKNKNAT